MKKRILILMLGIFSITAVLLVACNKDSITPAGPSLEDRLAKDPVFKNTILAATDIGMSFDVQSLSSAQNIEELKAIVAKINDKTATAADYDRVETITGVS